MIIRVASIADAKNIADIHTISWRNTYQNALSEQYLMDVVPKERYEVWKGRLENPKFNQYVVVAEYDGEVVGFVCVYAGENPDWGSYLDNLHVRETFQSQGIGKSLLIEGTRWCLKREPAKGLCLLVNQDNIKAQEFYKWLGACNAQKSVWNAPDGSIVPTFWFVWENLSELVEDGKRN